MCLKPLALGTRDRGSVLGVGAYVSRERAEFLSRLCLHLEKIFKILTSLLLSTLFLLSYLR
jgi:hypothetical protein